MEWFKHSTQAHNEINMQRLLNKYGLKGWGFYWYCLELMAASVFKNDADAEQEIDLDMLAKDIELDVQIVQEMFDFMIDIGMFEGTEVMDS